MKSIKLVSRNFIFLFCCIISGLNLMAQKERVAIRTNSGYAISSQSGYYFSFDIGIPITKYFEVSPTFTGSSMTPKTFVSYYWKHDTGSPSYGYPVGGPKNTKFSGDIYTSVGCVLNFKPLKLLSKSDKSKSEILIGIGYGYDSYTRTYAYYEIKDNKYDLLSFNQKSVNDFSLIFAKISYNRYFNDKAFYGIVANLNDFDGDGAVFIGLQLGSKL